MDERPTEITDPPLTRRELRRREQAAAHATEVSREGLPPGIPPRPAANRTAPRRSPSGRTPQWAIDEAAGKPSQVSGWRGAPAPAAYDWEAAHSGSAYVPPNVRRPSRVKRFIKALGRTIRDIFDSLWSLTKLIVIATLTVVVLWNVLAHLAPGFTADAWASPLASHATCASASENQISGEVSGECRPQWRPAVCGKRPRGGSVARARDR